MLADREGGKRGCVGGADRVAVPDRVAQCFKVFHGMVLLIDDERMRQKSWPVNQSGLKKLARYTQRLIEWASIGLVGGLRMKLGGLVKRGGGGYE